MIVLRGCGVDRSNVRGGGDLTFILAVWSPRFVMPWFLNLYYPLLTLYMLCILHVIVRCLFIVIVCIVEGQRPVHLIPHLHCWLALIDIDIHIDTLYSTGTVFNILVIQFIQRTAIYKQKLTRLNQLPPNNQRINQFLAISESCTTGNSADDLEAEFLPDLDRGRVIFEDQVEDGVFVALPLLVPRVFGKW